MEENIRKWRFPGNNYTQDQGIDNSDMETFAKDPLASLARESCQNSIDARISGKRAIVEFKSFDLKKEDIPGIERIEEEIASCKEYQKDNKNIYEPLVRMENSLNQDKIPCIRISDFNTTGLCGVAKTEKSPFFSLTKGSGISEKNGSAGGSKGIGKFASFVASSFNTVFYSTLTTENEQGHIGICKLCSTRIPDSDEKTIGIGYYANNKKNSAIFEQIIIDKTFCRTTPGTDIYILGFRKANTWKQEIITKILDSFMSAIQFEQLEVHIDDVVINKDTLFEIVNNEKYISKKAMNNIKSQYILLTDPSVYQEKIEIKGYGFIQLYLKGFNKENSHLATNDCVMVRFPYMKIKSFRNISSVPCSAMCIIEDNELNKLLRSIENPQHTDWEPKRVDDSKKKSEIYRIIRELKDIIGQFVYEKLSSSDNVQTDVEGASDFLPESGENSNIGQGAQATVDERPRVVKRIKNKVKETVGATENEDGQTLQPDLGSHEEGDGSPTPQGKNSGTQGEIHDSDNEYGVNTEGDNEIMKLVQLTGMKYRFFMPDKLSGECFIVFESQYTEDSCELEINYLDDAGVKYQINMTKATINDIPCTVENAKVTNLKLETGKKYKLKLQTNLNNLYACEVKIYASR